MPLDPVITPEKLAATEPASRVLLDARSGPDARAAYAEAHLAGAQFVDLEHDLAGHPADAAHGGRHPLPEPSAFAARLGAWGITPDSHVVVYDDQNGANAAARVWWMLRALGHERVQVLDGGLQAARSAGLKVDNVRPTPRPAPPYPARTFAGTVTIDDVERARKSQDALVVDVRAAPRFAGKHEPIDPVAGHIPGAVNVPLTENLEASGRFKSAEALRALYAPVLGTRAPEQAIVHCGSGVTACHTLLALERAGLGGASLYVGSWSEWCRQPQRERAP
jgi:thiosulfate/3-mercaptopyruvate sulfurtransferase